jgi:hypothetical protein
MRLLGIIRRRYDAAKPRETRPVTVREQLAARISARNRSGH